MTSAKIWSNLWCVSNFGFLLQLQLHVSGWKHMPRVLFWSWARPGHLFLSPYFISLFIFNYFPPDFHLMPRHNQPLSMLLYTSYKANLILLNIFLCRLLLYIFLFIYVFLKTKFFLFFKPTYCFRVPLFCGLVPTLFDTTFIFILFLLLYVPQIIPYNSPC